jgi:hypothetical protein
MPIPELNSDGHLPPGIFDCALADIKSRFGAFQISDRRPRLFARLEELFTAMKASSLLDALIIDGSFVTGKPVPNDIDIIAVLRSGQNLERDLPMSEYALLSRNLLRRRFGFDVIVAEQDSSLYRAYVDFFSRVREAPELRKGLLRLLL